MAIKWRSIDLHQLSSFGGLFSSKSMLFDGFLSRNNRLQLWKGQVQSPNCVKITKSVKTHGNPYRLRTRGTPNVCRNKTRFRRCLWPSHVLSAFLGFGRFVPRHSGAGWHGKLFRLNEKSKAKVFPSRWFLSKVNMEEINQNQITNSRGRGKYQRINGAAVPSLWKKNKNVSIVVFFFADQIPINNFDRFLIVKSPRRILKERQVEVVRCGS